MWISRFVNGMWLGWERCSTLPARQHSAGGRLVGDREEGVVVEGVIGGDWPVVQRGTLT